MSSGSVHVFLFSSLDSKNPLTARKVHIRRLYDILQLSLQRNDFLRAKRAWAVLARCKEMNWKSMWTTGLALLGEGVDSACTPRRLDYLRSMMLQHPDEREAILQELIFYLVLSGKCRDALDELELYLPCFPYQDNPVFHTYAGLISLYLAQPTADSTDFNTALLRDAQSHLRNAHTLNPDNIVAPAFLQKIHDYAKVEMPGQDSEDESAAGTHTTSLRKRPRV
ncbi:uncharacterized protein LACBIDRAFT_311636 [Laccaria bicolor S238N-H82]|uniref:Predicted protein n=1 Tax=Laccaria bicolor (strain S238N-H82 / ATCC MYA-4686) TaxID=486041 RepID=B0CXW5_LACBS|nr:uncharacterized protein LACBIDRAFT_311636 [Laccaria bicolor S238N-H82]EDR12791.1 predicted protein [Laccaria bicolor S238N-H82]|eukprot:XP_001877055.1 predicted protein [Laccaria bicolor S238N-H82]